MRRSSGRVAIPRGGSAHARIVAGARVVAGALTLALLVTPATTHGATPTPGRPDEGRPIASERPVIGTGDSRSDGGGPGLVGSPVGLALGVVLLGVITAAGTLVMVRVSRRGRSG